MLKELLSTEELLINHLDSVDDVFETIYQKDPRHNVRIRLGVFAGGGAKGLISLTVAKAIEDKIAEENAQRIRIGNPEIRHSLVDTLDAVSGTSTGAIIACLLTLRKSTDPLSADFKRPKYTVDQIIEKYEQYLPKIFAEGKIKQKFRLLRKKGMFSSEGLKAIIEEEVGDMIFNEQNFLIPVHIPVMDITHNKSIIFRTEDNLNNRVSDILLSTTAAAPFFAPHTSQFEIFDELGVVVNQEITACDGAFHSNTPDTDIISYYASPQHPVKKRSLLHHLNKGVETSITAIEFGTGDIAEQSRYMKKKSALKALFAALPNLLSPDKDRDLIDSAFKRFNDKNGKSAQYDHRHIVLTAPLETSISISASSKKEIKKLKEAGLSSVEKCEEEIEAYVYYDFVEYLLRKCDRKMQECAKSVDFHNSIREKEIDLIELMEENALLLSKTNEEAKTTAEVFSKIKANIASLDGSPFSSVHAPKQRALKEFLRLLEEDILSSKRRTEFSVLRDVFVLNNVTILDSVVSERAKLLQGASKVAMSNYGGVFGVVNNKVEQEKLYNIYIDVINKLEPGLIPDEKSSAFERFEFTKIVKGLHLACTNRELKINEAQYS